MIANKKTNIIFILSDDQGYWAMGSTSNNKIKTPVLDKLAHEGTTMDNFFCTSPVCSPARASLLTGKIPSQHGVHDWLRPSSDGEYCDYLQGQTTYVDLLKKEGYCCALSGKWHLGNAQHPPESFDYWYALEHGGDSYYNASVIKDGQSMKETKYITEAVTDYSISFMEEQTKQENPFYISINYTAPHSPWINQHPKEFTDIYSKYEGEDYPKREEHPWSTTNYSENHIDNLRGYLAAITAMDHHIGRIINKLDELDIRENTLIIFSSDNGFNFGHHGIWGKGNGTFPQNMYDTSVKVPAIFNHKGTVPENIINDTLVSGYDIYPTILEYAGVSFQSQDDLPGKSFYRELMGEEKRSKDGEVIIYDEYGPVRMIRTNEWKYIHRYPYGPNELYCLANDPEEKNNLIFDSNMREQMQKMKEKLTHWFLTYADPTIDGSREGVRGAGQTNFAGGIDVYAEWDDSAQ